MMGMLVTETCGGNKNRLLCRIWLVLYLSLFQFSLLPLRCSLVGIITVPAAFEMQNSQQEDAIFKINSKTNRRKSFVLLGHIFFL
jgi:hypothetical protein